MFNTATPANVPFGRQYTSLPINPAPSGSAVMYSGSYQASWNETNFGTVQKEMEYGSIENYGDGPNAVGLNAKWNVGHFSGFQSRCGRLTPRIMLLNYVTVLEILFSDAVLPNTSDELFDLCSLSVAEQGHPECQMVQTLHLRIKMKLPTLNRVMIESRSYVRKASSESFFDTPRLLFLTATQAYQRCGRRRSILEVWIKCEGLSLEVSLLEAQDGEIEERGEDLLHVQQVANLWAKESEIAKRGRAGSYWTLMMACAVWIQRRDKKNAAPWNTDNTEHELQQNRVSLCDKEDRRETLRGSKSSYSLQPREVNKTTCQLRWSGTFNPVRFHDIRNPYVASLSWADMDGVVIGGYS
ncbi:hypothetical protein EDD18DRAFT_1101959 [Armillaria luteobubalina]|uniref:Uncharacterized protein n=1 Tax=Armillaria luteobubalina TaxID=153913 RepID=A0AA39QDT5_9AGAR|nr:hypothetical protein EDD18DRAFT_1101959 [Armillaria luteobubalina]